MINNLLGKIFCFSNFQKFWLLSVEFDARVSLCLLRYAMIKIGLLYDIHAAVHVSLFFCGYIYGNGIRFRERLFAYRNLKGFLNYGYCFI